MSSNKKIARIAGFMYLILAVCAAFSWNYFNSLYVPSDALTTVSNIQASGWLFRLSFISSITGQIAFLFLAYFLYKLFRPVNKDWARLMSLLVFACVPIAILNTLNLFAPILLIMLFFDLHAHGVFIAGIFWGLWLFPLSYLVLKSGFIPKIIGIFLIIAGFGYIIDSLLRFLMSGYTLTLSSYTFIGEAMMIFWLLFKGAKIPETKKIEGDKK
jgi:hypothetical protein